MLTTKRIKLDCLDWPDKKERQEEQFAEDALEDFGLMLPAGSQLGLVPRVGHNAYESDVAPEIKFKHGTTTLAFLFDGGVIVAVDSRSTMGSYIGICFISYSPRYNLIIFHFIRRLRGSAECLLFL